MLKINIQQKKYNQKVVLKDLLLEIDTPGIYGVIGKNGQGKTTLFKCAVALENYKGDCLIESQAMNLQNTAFCPTEPFIYPELSASEFYKFYSKLFNLNSLKPGEELFDVPQKKLLRDFSTGMKKKAYYNAVFQKDFKVYLLDEPFNGLDIESNYILINYLKQKAKDSIVIISSHILDILFNNCKAIFMLDNKTLKCFQADAYREIEEIYFKK